MSEAETGERLLRPVVWGRVIEAQFSVERVGDRYTVTLESRSGAKGSYRERNRDYEAGLAAILQRLATLDALLLGARIAPRTGLRETRSDAELRIDGGFPVRLAQADPGALRLALQRAQRSAALLPGAKASNNQRRLALGVSLPLGDPGVPAVEALLVGGDAETPGRTGWTPGEDGLLAGTYRRLLEDQYGNLEVDPSGAVRELEEKLVGRSRGEIEARLGELSGWLREAGRPWLDGLGAAPLEGGEIAPAALRELRNDRLAEVGRIFEESTLIAPRKRIPTLDEILVEPPSVRRTGRRGSRVRTVGTSVTALRDFHKRVLGRAGEKLVLDVERETLRRAGNDTLADQVEWTADELGDGFGYDIASFRPDGSPRLIEVKTTNDGARTPFYLTRWEREVSRDRAEEWALYRVHGFATDPRIYILEGWIEDRADLSPQVYLGVPR